MRLTSLALLALAFWPISLEANESICLKTGFCMDVTSHMISGTSMVLQTATGTMEIPVDQIEQIVPIADVPVPPKPILIKVADPQLATSEQMLLKAAIEQGLEPGFVQSVARVESGLRQDAVSPKGALGLMQLMPKTAGQLGVNPARPSENAEGGAMFLRQLLLKYNGNAVLALAAYNAGPGAVDKYKGVPPYAETRKYVVKVLKEYARQQKLDADKALQAEKTKAAPIPNALASAK